MCDVVCVCFWARTSHTYVHIQCCARHTNNTNKHTNTLTHTHTIKLRISPTLSFISSYSFCKIARNHSFCSLRRAPVLLAYVVHSINRFSFYSHIFLVSFCQCSCVCLYAYVSVLRSCWCDSHRLKYDMDSSKSVLGIDSSIVINMVCSVVLFVGYKPQGLPCRVAAALSIFKALQSIFYGQNEVSSCIFFWSFTWIKRHYAMCNGSVKGFDF